MSNIDRTLHHLRHLIAFETISGLDHQQQVSQLFKYVTNSLPLNQYTLTQFQQNGHLSQVIVPKHHPHPPVFLYCHVDVVPAPSHLFKAKNLNGRLLGRGASDMKFALAAYLPLLTGQPHIGLVLTSDEEIGGVNGLKYLVDQGVFDHTQLLFMPDGGNDFSLVTAEKGVLHLKISTRGQSTHGSRPWEGKNAIDSLINSYHQLSHHFNQFQSGYWTNTINIGKISGGDAVNKVPDHASIHLDIRFIQPFTPNQILNKIKNAFSSATEITVIAQGDCVNISLSHPLVKLWIDSVTHINPRQRISQDVDHGSSDARFISTRIPIIISKPLSGGHHSDTEWIDITSLANFQATLAHYLDQLPLHLKPTSASLAITTPAG